MFEIGVLEAIIGHEESMSTRVCAKLPTEEAASELGTQAVKRTLVMGIDNLKDHYR